MDNSSKRYTFTYISRSGLAADFNFIGSFLCEAIEAMKIVIFLSLCVTFAWVSILSEDYLIPLHSNLLYELFSAVSRVVQIFPNLLLATDR